ncbi:CBS domain-containing protein [Chitinophaga costaii]|uniref:CBS domain-containing protein n=1 Tax=Chitinophaga costaii TaxID=1335309 RepID=A0A1C4F6S1_9BACT|nr:CBS domain-containing protein [Chitinophaga costaii]PUZ21272.1 CBS domain-containing protein [Chitinophaga costaii]SCC51191.1 CBS domain-containing protein [Chitinophaga costaii]
MLTRDLISTVVPVLHPKDTGARAMRLMNEFHLTQLPLVVDNKYQQLIEEEDVMDWEDPDLLLETIEDNNFKPAVSETAHIFEALKLFADFKLTSLPVLSKEGDYMGVITRDSLLMPLAAYNAVKEHGGIIGLEVDPRDYSLTEIARIAESNDVTILSVNTLTIPSNGRMEVMLKTNRQELSALVATFERFNYTIRYIFTEEQEEDLLKKNYDLLMNYMSM